MNAPRCPLHVAVVMEQQPAPVRKVYGKQKPENILRYRCAVAKCIQVAVVEKT
jgi:hypothetical protein